MEIIINIPIVDIRDFIPNGGFKITNSAMLKQLGVRTSQAGAHQCFRIIRGVNFHQLEQPLHGEHITFTPRMINRRKNPFHFITPHTSSHPFRHRGRILETFHHDSLHYHYAALVQGTIHFKLNADFSTLSEEELIPMLYSLLTRVQFKGCRYEPQHRRALSKLPRYLAAQYLEATTAQPHEHHRDTNPLFWCIPATTQIIIIRPSNLQITSPHWLYTPSSPVSPVFQSIRMNQQLYHLWSISGDEYQRHPDIIKGLTQTHSEIQLLDILLSQIKTHALNVEAYSAESDKLQKTIYALIHRIKRNQRFYPSFYPFIRQKSISNSYVLSHHGAYMKCLEQMEALNFRPALMRAFTKLYQALNAHHLTAETWMP